MAPPIPTRSKARMPPRSVNNRKKTTIHAILFAASAIAAVAIGFALFDGPEAESALRLFGYWLVLLLFILFTFALYRSHGPAITRHLKSPPAWYGIGLAIVATLFLSTREERNYKVVMDEPNLAVTAISMHEHRTPAIIEPSFGNIGTLSAMDKRPFFFPFLVSIAHDLTGFRPANPFIVNTLCCVVLLYLTYHFTYRMTRDKVAATLPVLLLCAHPLVCQNANGAGFELLNVVMILAAALLGCDFNRNPNRRTLATFVLAVGLLGQTRYESAVFIVAAAILVGWRLLRDRSWIISRTLILYPLLLLPIAWQNTFVRSEPRFWQLDSDTMSPFGVQYLVRNLKDAVAFFFDPEVAVASSGVVSALAALGAAFLLVTLVIRHGQTKRRIGPSYAPLALFTATIVANFLLLMCYHWGNLSDQAASRLALPLIAAAIIGFGGAAGFARSRFPDLKWLPTTVVLAAFVVTLPLTSRAEYSNTMIPVKRFEWVLEQIGSDLNDRTLVITPSSRIYSSYGIPSISPQRAVLSIRQLAFHEVVHTYDSIFVIQNMNTYPKNGDPSPKFNKGQDLGPAFKLETIASVSRHPYNLTRLSRVVDVDAKALEGFDDVSEYYHRYLGTHESQNLFRVSEDDLKDWQKSLP